VQQGGDSREKALRLCRRLSQLQESARDLRQLEGSKLSPAEDSGSWPCQALATPLVARFRHHFCRPDSELCRTDKPEWAFRYLVEMASDHAAELEGWLAQLCAEDCRPMVAGLVAALATEGRRFVAGRLRALSEDEEAKPWLLQTLHQLVRFHSALLGLGGTAAAQALMADFDGNVLRAPGEPSEEPGDSPSEPAQRGLLAARLAGALRREEGAEASRPPRGFLDLWADVDAEFVRSKLSASLAEALQGPGLWSLCARRFMFRSSSVSREPKKLLGLSLALPRAGKGGMSGVFWTT